MRQPLYHYRQYPMSTVPENALWALTRAILQQRTPSSRGYRSPATSTGKNPGTPALVLPTTTARHKLMPPALGFPCSVLLPLWTTENFSSRSLDHSCGYLYISLGPIPARRHIKPVQRPRCLWKTEVKERRNRQVPYVATQLITRQARQLTAPWAQPNPSLPPP